MATSLSHQQRIDSHFDTLAQHWKDLYSERSLEGVIHQRRRSLALRWILSLELPIGTRVLEVGCGAGLVAIELARHGYDVDCIDSSMAMVELAADEARQADVPGRVTVDVGDVHSLGFDSGAFDLVVALGVVPFLHSTQAALFEMGRVTRPGGWALFSSDNKYRMNRVLDPRYTPLLGREAVKSLLTGAGVKPPSSVPSKLFSSREIRRMTKLAGFSVDRCQSLGYGPFTFLGRDLLADSSSIKVDDRLQNCADRHILGLQAAANQHLILARAEPPHSSH